MEKPLQLFKNRKFRAQFEEFRLLSSKFPRRFDLRWEDRYPILTDAAKQHGFDRHYIYHTGWAARKLKEIAPASHVDVSSSLYFNAIASAFIPIKFYDFRMTDLTLSNLSCDEADLTHLPFESDSIESISCMHVIEHIGLGRYGDVLDPNGDLKAFHELKRVLKPGGSLLLVIPIGKAKILFNAHRIYAYSQIIETFNDLELKEFSLVPDSNEKGIILNASQKLADQQNYGCGCFWFMKREKA